MPAYDYVCEQCGREFEVRMSMAAYSEGVKPECPHCGACACQRAFTAVNVVTGGKGGGGGVRCGSGGFS